MEALKQLFVKKCAEFACEPIAAVVDDLEACASTGYGRGVHGMKWVPCMGMRQHRVGHGHGQLRMGCRNRVGMQGD